MAALVAAIALRPYARPRGGREGEVVPDFELQRVTGSALHTMTIDSPLQHRGKVLLLHFWAPSCLPCRAELPIWADLARDGSQFTVLTVAGDEADDVVHYLNANHLALPTVWDESGVAHRALGVWSIPRTFVVSRTGVIVRDLDGPQTREALLEAVRVARQKVSDIDI